MRDKDLLKELCLSGWAIHRITGSHHILKKGEETIVISVHGRDIPVGLLHALRKKGGLV